MRYAENSYISTEDLLYKGVLDDVKKSKLALQPIFEAFTNALEAIKIKSRSQKSFNGKIRIEIHATETTTGNPEFSKLSIIDNGVGFNEEEFKRFNTYKDYRKGFSNLGSGRIQFAHHFDTTVINSVFSEKGEFFEREFVVSKKDSFLKKNAIVLHKFCKKTKKNKTGSNITFNTILEKSNIYNELNEQKLKDELLERYLSYFCQHRSNLPHIQIEYFLQTEKKGETSILDKDIPRISKSRNFSLPYSRISVDGKSIEKNKDKKETFKIDAYQIEQKLLKSNSIKLVSKGEIVEDSPIKLHSLGERDNVGGQKYLFLISSKYIDSRDTNVRGVINIPDRDSFGKDTSIFSQEEILLEDIEETVNQTINSLYPEFEKVKKEHEEDFQKLVDMFLLDDNAIKDLNLSINDDESKILQRIYESDARKIAKIDAAIKESIDKLDEMDTSSEDYLEDLEEEVKKLAKAIPLQNKTALTQYVARRKLVIELLDKILDRKLKVQNTNGRNFDEELIHNLLFQQGSDNPENSDLWILNEEFIYFKGSSEKQLSQLQINGERVFKDEFSEEEERYLKSLGEDRLKRRPDVLLFPEEGKCIIIEFKAPNVNASDHLTQIDKYANLILNYSEDKFLIQTFYGYLIGQNIELKDVLGTVSRYEHSYQFDYMFRPSEKVNGFEGRANGSIYTEVIKYKTILERAKRRNKIFIDKLQSSNNN